VKMQKRVLLEDTSWRPLELLIGKKISLSTNTQSRLLTIKLKPLGQNLLRKKQKRNVLMRMMISILEKKT